MIELLVGTALGALVSWLGVSAFRRRNEPPPLPPAAGPPADRGEAVRRVLKHLQRKTIAELADGDAAVVIGRVKPVAGLPALRSPVTGTECLGFHVDVREVAFDELYGRRQVYDEARCVDIDVEDGTGTIRVNAAGLELAITDGTVGHWEPPFPPRIHAMARGYQFPVTVEEGLLLPGALVLVCGLAVRELAATDYRDGTPTFALHASPTFPLVASTDPDLLTPGERPIRPEELRRL